MKIRKYFYGLLLVSIFTSINLSAQTQTVLPVTVQNGLTVEQFLDEDTKIKIINSIEHPAQVTDSCILYDEYGQRKQGNLYLRNDKKEIINIQYGLLNSDPFKQGWWSKPGYEYIFDYDSEGNKILEEYYEYFGIAKDQLKKKTVFTYDEAGRCVEELHLNEKVEYTYTELGQVEKKKISLLSNTDLFRTLSYVYNDKGYLLTAQDKFSYNTVWDKYMYTYDDMGFVVQVKYAKVSDEEIKSESITNYTNSYQGNNLISSIAVDAEGVKRSETEYTYDDRGNKTSIINYDFDATTQERDTISRLLTIYDERDNLIFYERTIWNTEKQKWVGESVTPSGNERLQGRKEWTYDEDGNVATAKYYLWDQSKDDLVLSRSIVFYNKPKQGANIENNLSADLLVCVEGGDLVINSPASEEVSVYSLAGNLVLRADKEVGQSAISLNNIPEGIYIVKGSSGWTRKINF